MDSVLRMVQLNREHKPTVCNGPDNLSNGCSFRSMRKYMQWSFLLVFKYLIPPAKSNSIPSSKNMHSKKEEEKGTLKNKNKSYIETAAITAYCTYTTYQKRMKKEKK